MAFRKSRGASLALVAAVTLILALFGSGIFYLVQILAGSKQVTTATDAGALNVATAAALFPTVTVAANPSSPTVYEQQIMNAIGNDPTTPGVAYNVNLLNINKIITWGFIVALNAAADGTPTAQSNAYQVWWTIEAASNPTSITARLKNALTDPNLTVGANIPWVQFFFNAGAQANPQQFANSQAISNSNPQPIQIQNNKFNVAYVGQGDATNVQFGIVANNLPYTNIDTGTRITGVTIPQTPDGFVQGYTAIPIPGVQSPSGQNIVYAFVTNYGDQNPGLRSFNEFNANLSQPTNNGLSAVTLPPNAFFNQATITMSKSNSSLTQSSAAAVGTLPFPMIAPASLTTSSIYATGSGGSGSAASSINHWPMSNSYIVFDNTPQQIYTGPFPGACDNVICDELGQGIYVLTNTDNHNILFSLNLQSLDAIQSWWNAGGGASSAPSTSNVYTWAPGAANISTAAGLSSFLSSQNGDGALQLNSIITCNDQNSDPNDPNSISNCSLSVSGFNTVYHPNASKATYSANVDGLTAAEMAKDTLFQVFNYYYQMENFYAFAPSEMVTIGGAIAFNLNDTYTTNSSNGSLAISSQPYPLISGLAQYLSNANPITNAYANIPWGTNGIYPNYEYNPNKWGAAGISGGPALVADEIGEIYCCSGADWVDPNRLGKVTQPLSLTGIIEQTTALNSIYYPSYTEEISTTNSTATTSTHSTYPTNNPSTAVYNWFVQRCIEMGATQAQAQSIWNSIKMDINDVFCVYMANGTTLTAAKVTISQSQTGGSHGPTAITNVSLPTGPSNTSLIVNQMASLFTNANYPLPFPSSSTYIPPVIDGKTYAYSQQYNLLYSLVDAKFDFNIEDVLFYYTEDGNGCVVATDYVFLQSGTGITDSNLGRICFKERADNGPGPGPLIFVYGYTTSSSTTPSCSTSSPPIPMGVN